MKWIKEMVLLFCVNLLVACASKETEQLPVYQSLDDLKGKKVAALTGCFQEALLEKEYPEVEVLRIENPIDMVQALVTRRCEALVMDDYNYLYYMQSVNSLTVLPEPLATGEMGACFGKGVNVELREAFNAYLKQIKADGTYDQIYDKWLRHSNEAQLPDIVFEPNAKPIRIGTSAISPPMGFIRDGQIVGFDVEIAHRFAASIGRSVQWTDMTFSALIPALVSGTQDMVLAAISITPERAKTIDFSDAYFVSGTAIGVRLENTTEGMTQVSEETEGFIEGVKNSFYRNIIEEDRYMMILSGLKLTALISLFAGLFGTILGGLVCWMRMCRWGIMQRLAGLYIGLMRGTPVLVLLMLMFYVVFAGTSIDAVMVAIITFGMNFAAYVSEMFRSSIESIDKGQTEAGIALGFTPVKTFCFIVMPQAFKQVLPVYKGELISLVKMTSIVGYIAVQDLTKVGDIVRSRTFDAFFPLIMVAVLYFILSWIFSVVLDFIAKKTS